MKQSTLAIIAGLALFLPGCIVTSLHPFYAQEDLVFEPTLLGTWICTPKDGEEAPNESAEFKRRDDKSYVLVTHTKDEPEQNCVASLFKLGTEHFLDLFPEHGCSEPGCLPVHRIMKINLSTNTLGLAEMKYDWLEKLIESDPAAIRHEVVLGSKDQDGKQARRIVLTASTRELQELLRRSAANPEAWNEPAQLTRRATASP